MPFRWFMEQALYHPEHGYYSSGRCVIGRAGDYFTNVSVGPLFGRLMAAQFAEIWKLLGSPGEFVIVEQGAHDGQFACDVLEAAREHAPEFFAALTYRIVEPFPVLRARQQEKLRAFERKVVWRESVAAQEPFAGVLFANELLDAMPVHLVRRSGGEWLERHVTAAANGFEFTDRPIGNRELAAHLDLLPMPLPDGYQTEINLAALRWIDEIAPKLTRGVALLVDYGFARDEFYAPHRTTGTLQCYAHHQVVPSPLMAVGEADITAHVDWTSIAERAAAAGLMLSGFADQHHFITGLLTSDAGVNIATAAGPKTKRALQTLLHPTFLGIAFQFLGVSKNMPADARLAGFRFGPDPGPLWSHLG